MEEKLKEIAERAGVKIGSRRRVGWVASAVVGSMALLVGALAYQLIPAMEDGAPSGSPGTFMSPVPVDVEGMVFDPGAATIEVEEVPSEWRNALGTLCARALDTEPATLLDDMRSGQSLLQRVRAPIAQDEVEVAFAQFRQLCAAVEAEQTTAGVTSRFEQRIDDIEERVARIEADACGPRFNVNWSYHIGRIENWDEDGNEDAGVNRFIRVVRQIETAFSYYEDIAVDTCAMHARREEALEKLDERREYDLAPHTIRRH